MQLGPNDPCPAAGLGTSFECLIYIRKCNVVFYYMLTSGVPPPPPSKRLFQLKAHPRFLKCRGSCVIFLRKTSSSIVVHAFYLSRSFFLPFSLNAASHEGFPPARSSRSTPHWGRPQLGSEVAPHPPPPAAASSTPSSPPASPRQLHSRPRVHRKRPEEDSLAASCFVFCVFRCSVGISYLTRNPCFV